LEKKKRTGETKKKQGIRRIYLKLSWTEEGKKKRKWRGGGGRKNYFRWSKEKKGTPRTPTTEPATKKSKTEKGTQSAAHLPDGRHGRRRGKNLPGGRGIQGIVKGKEKKEPLYKKKSQVVCLEKKKVCYKIRPASADFGSGGKKKGQGTNKDSATSRAKGRGGVK